MTEAIHGGITARCRAHRRRAATLLLLALLPGPPGAGAWARNAMAGDAAPPVSAPAGASSRAATVDLASIRATCRALAEGVLCGSCEGRGEVVRRVRIGSRPIGGGMSVPIHAERTASCAACDGEGCRSTERLARLVAGSVGRLERARDDSGAIAPQVEPMVSAALRTMLERAPACLAERTALLGVAARAETARSETSAKGQAILLVGTVPAPAKREPKQAKPAPRSGKNSRGDEQATASGAADDAAADGSGHEGGAAGAVLELVTTDGVRWRIDGAVTAPPARPRWVAVLGWLRPGPAREPRVEAIAMAIVPAS